MSVNLSVSLIIVSRKRPKSLRRTLCSLQFQSYQNFEVIVVSDAPDNDVLATVPFADSMTHLHCGEANISLARNQGLNAALGDIIAFCDDDAVPDPLWLERLIRPFENANVGSAGGFVRARNGIEFQWRGLLCDLQGDDHLFDVGDAEYQVVPFDGQRFAKLQGTNCAFRRAALLSVGAFDETFHFFLDETDVCLRLAKAGFDSAFVPKAQVHHGFAESDQRSSTRVPKSLFEIGASKKRFLEKHFGVKDHTAAFEKLLSEQKLRLIELMIDGRIEPRDITRLMKTLHDGFKTVRENQPWKMQPSARQFTPLGHKASKVGRIYAGSTLSKRKLFEKVTKPTDYPTPTLVMMFSITSLFHKRDFVEQGYWMQTGGLFGKSQRMDPPIRFQGLNKRIKSEFDRVSGMFPGAELQTIKFLRNFVLEKTKSNVS